jgi:hypothetical protein
MRSIAAAVLSMIFIVTILAGCIIVPIPAPDTMGINEPIPFSSSGPARSAAQPVTKRLDNLAVFGVTSGLTAFTAEERQRFSSELTQALKTAHPGYTLLSYNDVGARLGSGQQQQLLDDFQFSGNLNPNQLSSIKQLGVNFVVLARLERDTLRYAEGEPQLAGALPAGQQRSPAADSGRSTERTIVITFVIYDLDEQKLIWQGNGEAKRTYSNSFRYTDTGNNSAATADLRGRVQADLNAGNREVYPQPEALEELMRLAFANFAKQIPPTL